MRWLVLSGLIACASAPTKPMGGAHRGRHPSSARVPPVVKIDLPRPGGAARYSSGTLSEEIGSAALKGLTEGLHVSQPFEECVEHYRAALASVGETVSMSAGDGATSLGVLSEGRLVVAELREIAEGNTAVYLLDLAYPSEVEIPPRPTSAPPTVNIEPIEVFPGSVVSGSFRRVSKIGDNVAGTVTVSATVAKPPAEVRAHYEAWLKRSGYQTVESRGGVILGLQPDRMVFIVVAGAESSAYAVIYHGPAKQTPRPGR